MMIGRRVRRFSRGGNTPLPLLSSLNQSLSHTLTCWYCDYKISALNDFLFSFGRKHSSFLRIWFSMGITFSIAALLAATLVLLWNSTSIVRLHNANVEISTGLVSGFFSWTPLSVLKVPGFRLSLIDGGYIIFSTLVSVAVHEFGHAISAASEGVHIEYIAIFLATLFPGALVAFNYEILQSLPQFAVLRIYCAGIWHNAVFCAVCALALLLLPSVLYPFTFMERTLCYTLNQVLDVTSMSPLSGYLSPGDVVLSADIEIVKDAVGGFVQWPKKFVVVLNKGDDTASSSDLLKLFLNDATNRLAEIDGHILASSPNYSAFQREIFPNVEQIDSEIFS